MRPLSDPEEVTTAACELLGKHLGATRVMYAEADKTGETVTFKRDCTNGEVTSMAGKSVRLDDFGTGIVDPLRSGQVVVIDDVTADEKSAPYADAYAANGVRSFLSIPLMKEGKLRALLNAHDSKLHHWTDENIEMAIDMVDRTWAAVEAARAQGKLR
ncbi:GAF domain-containing protein, partial [Halorubrum sp. Atlit-28R]